MWLNELVTNWARVNAILLKECQFILASFPYLIFVSFQYSE